MKAINLKLGLVNVWKFKFSRNVDVWLRFWSWFWSTVYRWNFSKICARTHYMASRSYFGKLNSTLGSAVPLAMFYIWNWNSISDRLIQVVLHRVRSEGQFKRHQMGILLPPCPGYTVGRHSAHCHESWNASNSGFDLILHCYRHQVKPFAWSTK